MNGDHGIRILVIVDQVKPLWKMEFYRSSKRWMALFILTDWLNDVINEEVKIFVQWNFEIVFFVSMYCFHWKCMGCGKTLDFKGDWKSLPICRIRTLLKKRLRHNIRDKVKCGLRIKNWTELKKKLRLEIP